MKHLASKKEFYVIVCIVLLLTLGVLFLLPQFLPGAHDQFAQCLSEKRITFYGAFWCPHCAAQKELFGNSMKYVTYIECSTPDFQKTQICLDHNITSYPTWIFSDGSRLTGVQPLQNLSQVTGCSLEEKTH